MSSLAQILSEADEIIRAKTAGGISKTASAPASSEDDIFKLAAEVRRGPATVKEAAAEATDDEIMTVTEKIAHAAAIVDTWNNLPTIMKLAEFEERARGQGYSDEQIQGYIEKNASQFQIRSVFDRAE